MRYRAHDGLDFNKFVQARGTPFAAVARLFTAAKRRRRIDPCADQPPQSVEALTQFAALPSEAADSLRVLLHDDYLILYAVTDPVVYLLSIRHHRQLSFDFARHWPGPNA